MPQPETSESTASTPASPDRGRTLLLVSACTLLAIGVGINVQRHYAGALDAMTAEPELDLVLNEGPPMERRYTSYFNQPDESAPRYAAAASMSAEAGGQGQRHKGEEGRMGRPTTKSGLYAMRGPSHAIPQMARNFDPEIAGRNAGILGQMQQESGHFLASPYGAAFAVGNDDEDVWGGLTGTEVGDIAPPEPEPWTAEPYERWVEQVFVATAEDATSTFSVDVDTGSYSLVRKALSEGGYWPSPDVVRTEEMINYFDYDYPEPSGEVPFSVTTEVGPCPWDEAHRLVHVGLQGKHVAPQAVPPRNLVFLVDVSGSMAGQLPLVVSSLSFLTERLGARDTISIVVYAGAAGTVLPPTPGNDKATILGALDRLQAGGSTNGGEGIHLAYALAQEHFIEGGINRVMLATDGDFNVGVTGHHALIELIEAKRRSGVFLSVLGYGGSNYQDATMEQLADKGNGNYAYIDGLAEARKVLVEQAGATLVTIAKDVKLQVDFDPEQVRRYRLVGYDNRVLADADFADDTKDAGEIGSGHTVTALYEIEPAAGADEDDALMELKLRYKQPDGDRSRLVKLPVHDDGRDLGETTDDFRFSASVAAFAQALQGMPTKTEPKSLQAIRDLALGARGVDRHCRRIEFVGLVEHASHRTAAPLEPSRIECRPSAEPPPRYAEPLEHTGDHADDDERFDWAAFVIEVLYLLPPLLALPLFVIALRRPRRRRRR